MPERHQLKLKIARARSNLMFMILLSVYNIFATAFNGSFYMPFSATAVTAVTGEAKYLSDETGNSAFLTIGIVIACAILVLYALTYFFSKKSSKWLLTALILFGADCLVLLFYVILTGIDGWFIDILLHALLVYFLIAGVKAFIDFDKLPAFDEASDPIAPPSEANFGSEEKKPDYDEEEDTGEDEADEELSSVSEDDALSEPICKYDGESEPLLKGSKDGLECFAVKNGDDAELVINGYVCDRLDVVNRPHYKLCAEVNGINFSFEFTRTPCREAMFLYADSELLDSLLKDG